ncbi:MAG: hypothetical protein ACRQFF_15375 [Sphaerochaeta sp.]
MKKRFIVLLVLLVSLTGNAFASSNHSLINEEDSPVQFFAEYEQGFISILSHTIKIGTDGTEFNYVTQGGQDILFPFERINVGAVINGRHRVSFLYQPFELNTIVPFEDAVKVDGKTFGSDGSDATNDTPMELKYSFPFWRLSYSYDILPQENITLGLGLSLQIRNTSIVFKAVDGSQVAVGQNVGPVPALHMYFMWETPVGINLSSDITGSYASSALFNGADFDFEGSLLDASVRAGYRLKNNIELFSNFRLFGGTSSGTSNYPGTNWSVTSGDGRFSENNLWTFSATLGCTMR